jgi:prevent-host-death family protein
MNQSVGAYDAKTHLPKLLERVAKGERITITKRGVPVAMLVPPTEAMARDVEQVIAEFRRASAGKSLRGLSIKKLIEEGRRY